MDEYTVDVFANRDEPVPLISVTQSDVDASSSEAESISHRGRLKSSLSASRLKTKGQEFAAAQLEKSQLNTATKSSLQDRLFSKILQQVIPSSEDLDDELDSSPVDRRSSKYVSRPAFSLPVMTNNFRRFNARIGIMFVFQNRLIRLFTWRTPSHTLSFLATYTFVCLDPYLLIVVPLAWLYSSSWSQLLRRVTRLHHRRPPFLAPLHITTRTMLALHLPQQGRSNPPARHLRISSAICVTCRTVWQTLATCMTSWYRQLRQRLILATRHFPPNYSCT